MAKKLRVGLIGVGGIAGAHFPGWDASPFAEVVALGDINPETLARVGQQRGINRLYEDSWELIRQDDIDIIDICTPNAYHAPYAIAALEAGKNVLCEKPLAPTPAEIKKMIAARDKSGKLLMTAQHFHYQGSSIALKREIDQGLLGDIYHARLWMLRRAAVPLRPTFIDRGESGGGACIDIGVHILDLALWLMGHPKPVTVSGITQDRLMHQKGSFSIWGGAIPQSVDVEEFAAGFVRFDNGATMMLEVSWMLHHKTPGEDMQMWLYGDKAGAHWPSNEICSTSNKTKQQMNTQLQVAEGGEPHAKECMDFAECVAKGRPSPVPAEQSLNVLSILDALYKSSEQGKEVKVEV